GDARDRVREGPQRGRDAADERPRRRG
ncbi:MAG: hypothetical protein AVDCRST_MAG85-2222, partial [uncultured Solirubrobacteraceae bacterium]